MGRYMPVYHTRTCFYSYISYPPLWIYTIFIYLFPFLRRYILVSLLRSMPALLNFHFEHWLINKRQPLRWTFGTPASCREAPVRIWPQYPCSNFSRSFSVSLVKFMSSNLRLTMIVFFSTLYNFAFASHFIIWKYIIHADQESNISNVQRGNLVVPVYLLKAK
jgi:hypothetical protein